MYPYGLIGNCETAALVSVGGGIDWFCYPRFDSPSIFAAVLDRQRGGTFRIAPVNPVPAGEQAYVRDSNLLATTFHRADGTLIVTDFMPCFMEGDRLISLRRICRGVEARGGPVEVECVLDPSPGYGRARTTFAEREGIVMASGGSQEVILSSTMPLQGTVEDVDGRPRFVFRFTLEPGRQHWFTLGFGERYFALGRNFPSSNDATELAERTRSFWVRWLGQCLYTGPFQEAVRRSALVIKLLTYSPTGALTAAPTTSFPEDLGGDRNWDYRFCWLRDASYGIAALFRAGFSQEAADFINWIRDRAYDHDFDMQIVYRVDGDAHLPEQYLEHLAGFDGARPVRIGNRAAGQRQLDVFGAVIDCMAVYQRKGGFISTKLWHVIERFADSIWDLSREPDNGIWEFQGERKHHTHSKLWCWVALDRAITLARGTGNTAHVEAWERAANDLRTEIETRAWNPKIGAFTQAYDDECLDAAVLQMPVLGFLPASDPRMRATIETLSQRLVDGAYVRRYDCKDDQGYLSAAFLLCSFWYVDGLIGLDRLDAAERQLERLVALSSPLGLLAEGADPLTGAPRGNFPQAYSHLGLIDSAVRLERARLQAQAAERAAEPQQATG
ncbi:MAG: glycoside hydrolase family 15 protein [Candidatus Dormibacteraeota bacterium]|nr:glycoside hydrolase family 15 protein [Candidatus Dormibacteraeota bacterium]